MNKVQELLAVRNGAKIDKTELIRKVTAEVHGAVEAIFQTNPFVNIIAVEGYTPYFNDGDPCTWRLGVQVDWFGEAYHSPLFKEIENGGVDCKYANLLSGPAPHWKDRDNHPNYPRLRESVNLLETFTKEFEIMDNEVNGTWWMFIRKRTMLDGAVEFESLTDNFDHD